jgi:hypothetical protein
MVGAVPDRAEAVVKVQERVEVVVVQVVAPASVMAAVRATVGEVKGRVARELAALEVEVGYSESQEARLVAPRAPVAVEGAAMVRENEVAVVMAVVH